MHYLEGIIISCSHWLIILATIATIAPLDHDGFSVEKLLRISDILALPRLAAFVTVHAEDTSGKECHAVAAPGIKIELITGCDANNTLQ